MRKWEKIGVIIRDWFDEDSLKSNLIEQECYSTKHKNVAFVQENPWTL